MFKILLLLILILINGVFSATEIAFININKFKLSKEIKKNNKKAIKIMMLLKDSSTFLSAIQIAITLSGFLASAFASSKLALELVYILNITFISKELLTNILIVIITFILSYLTLVLGELVPKKIGLSYSYSIAFKMVDVIDIVIKLCKPFILILKHSTDFIINLFNIKPINYNMEDDIKNSITDSNLEELEKGILLNVFSFNDTKVEEVMTNKDDVVVIDLNDTKDDILRIIKNTKYTRFPVVSNNEIIGLVNIKDFIFKHDKEFNINNYIRKIKTVKHDMIIDDVFLYLNSNYEVMAKVEKNGVYIGIITIEDIEEEIIGNIFDEYDKK